MQNTMNLAEPMTLEVVLTTFNKDLDSNAQKQEMAKLNTIVNTLPGFISRSYFFNQEQQQWVDLVVWQDPSSAENAGKLVMSNAVALSVFEKMDQSKTNFGHYKQEGHVSI